VSLFTFSRKLGACSRLIEAQVSNLWPSKPFYAARHVIWEYDEQMFSSTEETIAKKV
jgi:hypothetical protein